MTAHDWFADHRVEFVTRALEAGDLDTFEAHLRRCDECRAAVAELERDLQWLPLGVAPVVPPPGMTRRLAAGVLERPSQRRSRWLPMVTAASVLVTIGVWSASRQTVGELRGSVDSLTTALALQDATLAATTDTLALIRKASRVMQARLEIGGQEAVLVIFEEAVRHRWTVVVQGLPVAPEGERFALWFICENGMRLGTPLPASGEGPAVLVVPVPTDLGAVLSASITRESTTMTNGMPSTKREIANLAL